MEYLSRRAGYDNQGSGPGVGREVGDLQKAALLSFTQRAGRAYEGHIGSGSPEGSPLNAAATGDRIRRVIAHDQDPCLLASYFGSQGDRLFQARCRGPTLPPIEQREGLFG